MKKLLLLAFAASVLGTSAYAQTQRTNRTNTRTHDRTEVTKNEPLTDQDKNNPDQNKSHATRPAKDSVGRAKR